MAAPFQAAHDHGRRAAGQLAALDDLSDDPDRCVPALDAGHEDQASSGVARRFGRDLGFLGLQGHREDHPRQHDARGQRQ